jgi:hypothetical protein
MVNKVKGFFTGEKKEESPEEKKKRQEALDKAIKKYDNELYMSNTRKRKA